MKKPQTIGYQERIHKINARKLDGVLAKTLRQEKVLHLLVTGSSMEPFLHGGKDRVVLRRAAAVRKGDIVLFRRPGGAYVLHRAVKICADGFYAAGDAQSWREGPVPFEQAEGVVEEIHRGGAVLSVNRWGYRLRVRLWMMAYPLRRLKRRWLLRGRAGGPAKKER